MKYYVKQCKIEAHMTLEWQRLYQMLVKGNKAFVNIHYVDQINQAIVMELVDGKSVMELMGEMDRHELDRLCDFIIMTFFWCSESPLDGLYANHLDSSLQNIFLRENGEFVLVDPNSVMFSKAYMYDKFVPLLKQVAKAKNELDVNQKKEYLIRYDFMMDEFVDGDAKAAKIVFDRMKEEWT